MQFSEAFYFSFHVNYIPIKLQVLFVFLVFIGTKLRMQKDVITLNCCHSVSMSVFMSSARSLMEEISKLG